MTSMVPEFVILLESLKSPPSAKVIVPELFRTLFFRNSATPPTLIFPEFVIVD